MSANIARSLSIACLLAGLTSAADPGNPDIHANQVGYFPDLPKIAVVRAPGPDSTFAIVSEPSGEVVHSGVGSGKLYWASADDTIRRYDFSRFTTPGTYRLRIPGAGVSYPFRIAPDIYTAVTKAAIKAFYFQRASTALLPEHAGVYARAAGHPDNAVRVHNAVATAQRPANSTFSSPKGWYDAGDYGKYTVNSGISTWTLLDAYLMAPSFFDTLDLNIPESGNDIPDILDEALWNLDWLLTMQDLDGGVYHKVTTASFSGFVMPANDKAQRYFVGKGTAATLDFAALMAQTSRVFRRFESSRPGLADTCLAAAIRAWNWAQAHPDSAFTRVLQKTLVNPAVGTGDYEDASFTDEKIWAGIELTLATRRDSFWIATMGGTKFAGNFNNPGWGQVASLGLMSALGSLDSLVGVADTAGMLAKLRSVGTLAKSRTNANPYRVPVNESDLGWGSTSVTGNMGLAALHWYKVSGDTSYRTAALTATDWVLGRNAVGVSFITGFGTVSPMNPHHRPSGADGIADPIPGFVVGGPNKDQQDATTCEADGASYAYALPALSWLDNQCSYASNEVAINWNAPQAALLGILQAGEIGGWTSSVSPRHRPRVAAGIVAARKAGGLEIASRDGSVLQEVRVLAASGRLVAQARPASARWVLADRPSGLLIVQARTASGWTSLSSTGF